MNVQKVEQLLIFIVLLTCLTPAWADWKLDNTNSSINFVSIKNDSVGEVHSFASLAGSIGATGDIEVAVILDSVETLVEIRNERMRELLFETVTFPSAQITARVDPATMAAALDGGVVTVTLPVTLSLHGQEKTLSVVVVATGDSDSSLRVVTARPVVINASDFGLGQGVTALKNIAGLQSISNAVPITLDLQFVASQ